MEKWVKLVTVAQSSQKRSVGSMTANLTSKRVLKVFVVGNSSKILL